MFIVFILSSVVYVHKGTLALCLRKKRIVGGNKCRQLLEVWQATRIELLDRPIAASGNVMEVAIVAEADAWAVGQPHRQLQRFIDAVDVGAKQEAGNKRKRRMLGIGLVRRHVIVCQESLVDSVIRAKICLRK